MKWFGVVVVLVCGCSKNPAAPDAPGTTSQCSVTLSGAQTGTFACSRANVVFDSSMNLGGFSIAFPSPPTPQITISLGFPGMPQLTHYMATDTGAKGGVSVVAGSGASTQAWVASADNGTVKGSYDLLISELGEPITTSSGTAYTAPAGTLTATLPSATGASTTVMVSATF